MAALKWWQSVLLIGGWVVIVAGLLLLLFALFGDRSRGRRRCPRCWYDLSGVPRTVRTTGNAWMCPECGRAIASDRGLLRTRRYWRRALLGVLVLLLGYGTVLTEQAIRDGADSAIPTVALAAMCPWLDPDAAFIPANSSLAPATPFARLKARASVELRRRVTGLRLRGPQRWMVFAVPAFRAARSSPDGPRTGVHTDEWLRLGLNSAIVPTRLCELLWRPAARASIRPREDWPADTPYCLKFDLSRWLRVGGHSEVRASLGGALDGVIVRTADPGSTNWVEFPLAIPVGQRPRICIELRTRSHEPAVRWRTEVELPPIRKARIDDAVSPVRGSAIDRVVAAAVVLDRTVFSHQPSSLVFDAGSVISSPAFSGGIGLAIRIDLLRDGAVVQSSRVHAQGLPPSSPRLVLASDVTDLATRFPSACWTVRIRGDQVLALREIGRSRYWDGEVERSVTPDGVLE